MCPFSYFEFGDIKSWDIPDLPSAGLLDPGIYQAKGVGD